MAWKAMIVWTETRVYRTVRINTPLDDSPTYAFLARSKRMLVNHGERLLPPILDGGEKGGSKLGKLFQ